jgi:hypothetical protein
MSYKELCNEDKVAAIAECHFWRGELVLVEQYAEALKTNDRALIESFESFGDSPQRIIQNKNHFDRASSAFGFDLKSLLEHNWQEGMAFADCETFHFGCGIKGRCLGRNNITIGRGPNRKWTYGLDLAASRSGCCYGLSVFNTPHGSRHECLRHGLEEMIAWHTRGDDRKTAPVIKEVKAMLNEITGRKLKQLSLF